MQIEIFRLAPQQLEIFKQVVFLFEDVFMMNDFKIPPDDHLLKLLQREDFFVFVAQSNLQTVGGMTAYTLHQYYSTSSFVYIYDLAVKTDFQRTGIGKKLISAIKEYCTPLGVEEIFVQADLEDQHALDFYRSTGGVPEDVIHFSYPLNPILR